jgi:hypothetical protein
MGIATTLILMISNLPCPLKIEVMTRHSGLRICTLEEVKEYFRKRTHELEDNVTEAKYKVLEAEGKLDSYKRSVDGFFKELGD